MAGLTELTDADLLHGLRTDLSRGVQMLLTGTPPLGPTER